MSDDELVELVFNRVYGRRAQRDSLRIGSCRDVVELVRRWTPSTPAPSESNSGTCDVDGCSLPRGHSAECETKHGKED